MTTSDSDKSINDDRTFAGLAKVRPAAELSLGDERTLGGGLATQDKDGDDIEVVDLEGRYKVEGTLGQGGMGAVLLAMDTRLGRKVAIKRILGEAAGNRMAVQRFLTEAKAIAALNHPNIVQIFDYGRAKDGPFLIMEYVDGGSLLDRCREGALPLEEAIDLACQICDGLAKAHDQQIIHRDIKPANVLLSKDGIPKLTDFGLAKAQASDHGQTVTGAVLGTPDFMPPEQRRDAAEVDARSDLWSLAATVYQMLTGRSPKIIRMDLVPKGLTDVLGKALEDEKENRYQSARDLRDALRTGTRAALAAGAEEELGEGRCPACGAKNDPSRKFCRGCGGSLEVPCLSCAKPMPIGEEVCGQCGKKQSAVLAENQARVASEQTQAEGCLGDLDFAGAARIVERLRGERHPAFAHLGGWCDQFLAKLEESRREQLLRAAEEQADASRHEAAQDYLSAIFVLESIPAAFQAELLPGASETSAAALARVKKKQAEALRLEAVIKQRVAARQLGDLLPHVAALLALQPARRDLVQLKQQLEARQAKQITVRDAAVAKAVGMLSRHEYEAAHAELAQIDESVETPESLALKKKAATLMARLRTLAAAIREKSAARRGAEVLPLLDEYLALKPTDGEALRLRAGVLAREQKARETLEAARTGARDLMAKGDFAGAVRLLETAAVDDTEDDMLAECRFMEGTRAVAMRALEAAAVSKDFVGGLVQADTYRQLLVAQGSDDAAFAQQLEKCERGAAEQKVVRTAVRIGSGVAAAVVASGLAWVMWAALSPTAATTAVQDARSSTAATAASGSVAQSTADAKGWAIGDIFYGASANTIGMKFVRVPEGEAHVVDVFVNAQEEKGYARRRGRRVEITRPFMIGQTEVTQAQWRRVMQTEPWKGRSPEAGDLPVTFVTRDDAIAFCVALTNLETGNGKRGLFGAAPLGRACVAADVGKTPGTYALPTGDQWDYACKGTRQSGIATESLGPYGWTSENSQQRPHAVGTKRPNRLGIYDMHGNVHELCVPETRGGGWKTHAALCGADRLDSYGRHDGPSDDVGFRVIVGL